MGEWSFDQSTRLHAFSRNPASHPSSGMGASWTASDADISSAVIVSLSASGKTARSCGWHLSQRPKASGPLGILQITSTPNIGTEDPIAKRTIAYGDVSRAETLEWIARLKPLKIVVLYFGGRGNSLDNLLDSMKGNLALTSLKVTIVQIGSEQKVYTKEEVVAGQEKLVKLGKIQFNSSGVRDAVIALSSPEAFAESVKPVWAKWISESRKLIPDMQIKVGKGIMGSDGIEGGWERLCKGCVGTTKGLLYKL